MSNLFGFNKKAKDKKSKKDDDAPSKQDKDASMNILNNEIAKQNKNAKENESTDNISTKHSDIGSSIFSKDERTYSSSKISSTIASSSRDGQASKFTNGGNTYTDLGKPLRVVNEGKDFKLGILVEEETNSETAVKKPDFESSVNKDSVSVPENEISQQSTLQMHLYNLETNLAELVDDIHQNITNISKAVIQAVEYFKVFLMIKNRNLGCQKISSENSSSLRNISKIVFHFLDNLLNSEGYTNSKYILLKRYLQFLRKININPMQDTKGSETLPHLKNFCLDYKLPNVDKIEAIIQGLLESDCNMISDQNGAFIAPIRRGLSQETSIISVCFGIENVQQEHHEMIKILYSLFPDIHFYIVRDSIKKCAKVERSHNFVAQPTHTDSNQHDIPEFIPPYRIAEDPLEPPISMSISTENDPNVTGTLGGYVFPQIEQNSKFSQFAGSSFAITSAHVVLSESQDYPHCSVPSTTLQNAYLQTLLSEGKRYPDDSKEKLAFLKEAEKVRANMKWQSENLFGQVVWGVRSIINNRLSDFAIIKVNPQYKCYNFLGKNLSFTNDPTLKFQNKYIKRKIMKLTAGMKVFKIGASSNYTSGQVNGTKLVYWADGKLQTSEFVVASPLPVFACAGDSGSWILTKSDSYLGLGVVGMLHSYDGSRQQFGLFTPIADILERLNDVTGIQWDIDPQVD